MVSTDEEKKYFTVEEVNQRLPLVRAIVADVVRLYHDVHDRRERLTKVRQISDSNTRDQDNVYAEELRQMEDEVDKDIAELQKFIDELRELGAELKDPVSGLIDFLTLVEGREAYLCWKLGEDDIGYWHELNAGFQGRQSVFESLFTGEDAAGEESSE